jgi:hypothetical protein
VTACSKRLRNQNLKQQHYLSALMRERLGNPPKKGDTVGDEVNWDTLFGHRWGLD